MYWVARILTAAVLVVVLVYAVGWLMPAERSVSKVTLIDALPELVFQTATDVDKFPLWRRDIRTVTLDADGDLKSWTEARNDGSTVRVRETAKEPLKHYVIEYESSAGFRGRWEGTFEPSNEDRTKLTCTETVIVDNPLFRLPAFVLLNTDARLDVLLGDLNRRAANQAPKGKEEPVVIPFNF